MGSPLRAENYIFFCRVGCCKPKMLGKYWHRSNQKQATRSFGKY